MSVKYTTNSTTIVSLQMRLSCWPQTCLEVGGQKERDSRDKGVEGEEIKLASDFTLFLGASFGHWTSVTFSQIPVLIVCSGLHVLLIHDAFPLGDTALSIHFFVPNLQPLAFRTYLLPIAKSWDLHYSSQTDT